MGNGDIGHIVRGYQTDYKRLYASNPEDAFVVPVTLVAGFGVVPQGTPLSKVTVGTNIGKYVPYNKTVFSNYANGGGAFLLSTPNGTDLEVTLEDSYRFAVGDSVIVADANTSTSSSEAGGLITAIDRTTYPNKAVIAVTSSITGATFTAAQFAKVFHIAGADNSNTWSDCAGILDVAVDTGVGANAKGGLGSMVIKNAMLYAGMCPNVDAAAIVDLSIKSVGQFYIL
jgi:hypothetical protein